MSWRRGWQAAGLAAMVALAACGRDKEPDAAPPAPLPEMTSAALPDAAPVVQPAPLGDIVQKQEPARAALPGADASTVTLAAPPEPADDRLVSPPADPAPAPTPAAPAAEPKPTPKPPAPKPTAEAGRKPAPQPAEAKPTATAKPAPSAQPASKPQPKPAASPKPATKPQASPKPEVKPQAAAPDWNAPPTGAQGAGPSSGRGQDKGTVVRAEVVAVSNVPAPGSVPYRECLTYIKYRVVDVESGDYQGKELLGVHWGMKDNKLTDAAGLKPGQKRTLTVEPFDRHPELQRVMQADDTNAYELAPYWVKEAR